MNQPTPMKKPTTSRPSGRSLRRALATTAALGLGAAPVLAAGTAQAATPADITLDWVVTQDWGTGYQVRGIVTNNTDRAVSGWALSFAYPHSITSLWDAQKASTGDGYQLTGPTWSPDLAPGASLTFGFVGAPHGGESLTPVSCTVAGLTCAVNDGVRSGIGSDPLVDPTPEPAPEPAPEPVTEPSAEPAPGAIVEGGVDVTVTVDSDWGTGRTVSMTIENRGDTTLNGWSVSMPWAGSSVTAWNAKASLSNGTLTLSDVGWNSTIAPGQAVSIGLNDTGTFVAPGSCRLSSTSCAINGTVTDPTDPSVPATDPVEEEAAAPETTDPRYTPRGPSVLGERKVIGYYPAWATYARDYQVADIPGNKVSHINYAFANIKNGQCVLGDAYADTDKAFAGDTWEDGAKRGNFNQLTRLRDANPQLNTMISVGGWTWSQNFSAAASTPEAREKFASSCVEFMDTWGFDGIDLDWEYPVSGGLNAGSPEDTANYTRLLAEIRSQLDAKEAADGREYYLSIAAPAGPAVISNMDVAGLQANTDWVNLMSYDFHGSWEPVTGHNAPMARSSADPSPVGWSVTEAVDTYLARGLSANKLVLGMGFYGRGWIANAGSGDGLYAAASAAPSGTWEKGVYDYTDIEANYLPVMDRYWDEDAQVPYLFNPDTGLFISYDDEESLAIKAEYVNSKDLGGAMIWELSGDRDEKLLDAINSTLD